LTRSKVLLKEIYLEPGVYQCEKCMKNHFRSYKEASTFIEKSEVTLYRAIKSGKKFKGCIWKRKSKEL